MRKCYGLCHLSPPPNPSEGGYNRIHSQRSECQEGRRMEFILPNGYFQWEVTCLSILHLPEQGEVNHRETEVRWRESQDKDA